MISTLLNYVRRQVGDSLSEDVRKSRLMSLESLILERRPQLIRDIYEEKIQADEREGLLVSNDRDIEIGNLGGTDNALRDVMLERFLENDNYNIEQAYSAWAIYERWRLTTLAHARSDAEMVMIENLKGFVRWTGRDSSGRLCCFLSGRHFQAMGHRKYSRSFELFVLEEFESGISRALLDKENRAITAASSIAIVYDRRSMTYENIDPHLSSKMKEFISKFREYYGPLISVVYLVHVNWFLWALFTYLFDPILRCWLRARRLIVLRNARDMLEFVDLEQLPEGYLLEPDSDRTQQ